MCECVHERVCVCVCMRVCVHMCVRVCVCAYMYKRGVCVQHTNVSHLLYFHIS